MKCTKIIHLITCSMPAVEYTKEFVTSVIVGKDCKFSNLFLYVENTVGKKRFAV